MQIVPFNLEKFKKNISSTGKKDIAKSMHKVSYSMMRIMTLKAMTRGMF